MYFNIFNMQECFIRYKMRGAAARFISVKSRIARAVATGGCGGVTPP